MEIIEMRKMLPAAINSMLCRSYKSIHEPPAPYSLFPLYHDVEPGQNKE